MTLPGHWRGQIDVRKGDWDWQLGPGVLTPAGQCPTVAGALAWATGTPNLTCSIVTLGKLFQGLI